MDYSNNGIDKKVFETATKPKLKRWTIGLSLIIIGSCVAFFGYMSGGRGAIMLNSEGLHFISSEDNASDDSYETSATARASENFVELDYFNKMSIFALAAEIELIESDCYGFEAVRLGNHTISGRDGTLFINDAEDGDDFYFMDFGVDGNSYIKIYYPEGAKFDSIEIENYDGEISGRLKNASNVLLKNFSGGIDISAENCASVSAESTSGKIDIEGIGTNKQAEFRTTSGGIDIKGGSWTDLVADSTSGNVLISAEELLGETEIYATSGEAEVSLRDGIDYGYALSATSGEISVNGEEQGGNVSLNRDAENVITIAVTSGDIDLRTNR